jgi:cell division protein FtsZ
MEGIKFELVGGDLGERNGARIKVIGVGGCGCNIVNAMNEIGVRDAELIAVNTDIQSLNMVGVQEKVQIGKQLTGGRGAGSDPGQGERAAEEDRDQIKELLKGTDMLFIAAGLGGGTGSGAGPVIAEIARELDILTVAVVITPFAFQLNNTRMKTIVETSHKRLKETVNNIIVIPNDKINIACDKKMQVKDAYMAVNRALVNIINGMVNMIAMTGIQNIDFEDVKNTLRAEGDIFIGIGKAEGTDKVKKAFENAIMDPFTGNADLAGAKNILVNFVGILNLFELEEISNLNKKTGENAFVKFGIVSTENTADEIEVVVLISGLNKQAPVKALEQPPAKEQMKDTHRVKKLEEYVKRNVENEYEDIDRPAYQRIDENTQYFGKPHDQRLQ